MQNKVLRVNSVPVYLQPVYRLESCIKFLKSDQGVEKYSDKAKFYISEIEAELERREELKKTPLAKAMIE